MLKILLVIPLAICACGCSQPAETRYQRTLDQATRAIRRGELNSASALAHEGRSLTRANPDTPWSWRFRLLDAEVLLRRHELSNARPLLAAAPPSGAAFDLLRARHQFLLGFEQLLAGEREAAADSLERARSLAPPESDLRLDIDVYAGITALQRGRWPEGEARLEDVLRAAREKHDTYHQAVALNNLGYGQLVRRRYDAALAWLERALTFADQRDTTIYADALNNAGLCYSRLGLFDRAIDVQRQAAERHKQGARREYAEALGELGATYILRGDLQTSLPYLRQALDVATEAGLEGQAALFAGNLSSAYVDLGQWDEAERFNDEARRLKTGNAGGALVYNVLNEARIAQGRGRLDEAGRLFGLALAGTGGNPSVQWSAHEGLAQVALATGRVPDAMRHFAAALDTVEKTRSDLMRTDYKLSYLTRLIDFYREYVDALVDRGQVERALEVADSSRGRVLAERQGMAVAPSAARPGALRQRAGEARAVLLAYWLAPARSYLWVVTPARVQIFTLPPAREIEALVRQHQAAIENVLADPLAQAGSAGDRLFELLVRPALPSIPSGGRVVIAPDAALYALNFETLPVRGPRAGDAHYLIEDFEIAVAPSLAMLAASPRAAARPEPSLLLIGNAAAHAPAYPALKFAGAEMAGVARHFPAGRVTSFEGTRAVPAVYRSAMPERFSHVHFTAHAEANVDSPLDSAVILSGPDGGFKLYARDVAALPLDAELVTVSACRSAGGRTYSGEGLVGFAWAFLRGGARRVVAGLWDVDDRSTAELMDAFYARLAAGEAVGRALRAAKLSLVRRGRPTAKPYYWAPFELFTLTP